MDQVCTYVDPQNTRCQNTAPFEILETTNELAGYACEDHREVMMQAQEGRQAHQIAPIAAATPGQPGTPREPPPAAPSASPPEQFAEPQTGEAHPDAPDE